MRILVVEDQARMAGLIKRGLEETGYSVDLADTGPDAVIHSGLGGDSGRLEWMETLRRTRGAGENLTLVPVE